MTIHKPENISFKPRRLAFYALLVFSSLVSAQCENSDFETGTLVNWMGFTGNCCGINTPSPGLVPGRHTITSSIEGIDPVVAPCYPISVVPPGGNYACRVGNSATGSEAERIQYTFNVTPESDLIIYKYAVILEDPGHDPPDQPRFEAQVLTQSGAAIPCTFYQVAASAGIPGFQNCGSGLVFKDWTTVGVDVSDYIGQTVTLDLATGDCSQGGHFGYAYVDALCTSLTLDSRYCVNANTAIISAPEGFTYLWSTGETSREIVIQNPVQGQVYTCQLTSVTGCEAFLTTAMEFSDVQADLTIESSCSNNLSLTNNSIYINGVADSLIWTIDNQVYTMTDSLVVSSVNPGTIDIQLVVFSDIGCVDSVQTELVIHAKPLIEIVPTQPCLSDSIFITTNVLFQENPIEVFSFVHDSNAPVFNDYGNFSVFSAIGGANEFRVTATDDQGCSDTVSVTYVSLTPLSINLTSLNNYGDFDISCYGLNDGSIEAEILGGLPPYSFQWINPPGNINPLLYALPAGNYSCEVTDANNCSFYQEINLIEPDPLIGVVNALSDFSGYGVSCYGLNNGAADFSFSGGVSPVSASLNGQILSDQNVENLSAGFYNIILIDSNSCIEYIPFEITQPDPLSANLASLLSYNGFDINCSDSSNGSIAVNIIGGVEPYGIDWGHTENSAQVIEGLGEGEYWVNVSDQNFCNSSDSITLVSPTPITASDSIYLIHNGFPISCHGLSDGQAELLIDGGAGEYSVSWSNGSVGNLLYGASAGNYTATISDINNCGPITLEIELTEPDTLSTILNVSSNYNGAEISCFGAFDGAANVQISGGVSPYSIFWADGSNGLASGFSFGNGYAALSIEDANHCIISDSIFIHEPENIITNIHPITNYNGFDISCFMSHDGILEGDASGGIGPYTFSWSNGVGTSLNPNLGQGHYSLLATDVNACSAMADYIITPPDSLEVYASVPETYNGAFVSCFGSHDGVLEATVFGGVGNVSYLWTNGGNSAYTSGHTLSAGWNWVIVSDANQCQAYDSIFSISPTPIQVSLSSIIEYSGYDVSCFGAADGVIEASVEGGVGQYQITWPGNSSQNQTLYNLHAGEYIVQVIDANGCGPFTETINLLEPPPITYDYEIVSDYNGQAISCYGAADGQAQVSVNGGVPPYNYLWQNGHNESISDISLYDGEHICYVEDVNGCNILAPVVVVGPEILQVNIDMISNYSGFYISCPNSFDGVAIASATGGTPYYSYTWSNQESGELANSLDSGFFSVSVIDINGCSAVAESYIIPPDSLQAQLSQLLVYNGSAISCAGAEDASVMAIVSGGAAPYSYNWSASNAQGNTNPAEGLAAGNVHFTVADANGCICYASDLITEPTELSAEVVVLSDYNGYPVSCFGLSNAYLGLEITGGTGQMSASWSNGVEGLVNSAVPAGFYNALVYDENGCFENTDIVQLNEPAPLYILSTTTSDYNGYNVSCNGGNNGWAQISFQGGISPYSVLWSNGATDLLADSLSAGVYMAMVSDDNNCRANEAIVLDQPPPISPYFQLIPDRCEIGMGRASVELDGGVPGYNIVWSNADTTEFACCFQGNSEALLQITDFNECRLDTSFIFPNLEAPAITASFTSDDPVCQNQSEVELRLTSDFYPIEWSILGDGFRILSNDNPVTIMYTEPGDVPTDIVGTIAPGCKSQLTVVKEVFPEMKIFVPNSFTPGDDGINDAFQVYGENIALIEWSIFDRWGNLYFQGNSLDAYWNGTKMGGNKELLPGIYEWVIKAVSFCGVSYESTGHVSLLR